MRKHKICVIGAGNWGLNHIKTLFSMNQLVSCVDNCDKKLNNVKSLFPEIKCFKSLEDSFRDDYDGYVVATPSITHKEISIQIIKKNKPLLVEKPISLSLEDSIEIKNCLESYKGRLLVGHLMLFHPAITKIKSMINQGKIGKIIYMYSNRLNFGKIRKNEDVLWSFAPHDISIFQYFINSFPISVRSEGMSFLKKNIYDTIITNLEYPSKIKAHIFNSWINPFKEHKIVIIGTKGSLCFEDSLDDKPLLFFQNKLIKKNLDLSLNDNQKKEKINYKFTPPLENELKYFFKLLRQEPVNIANIDKAIDVVRVLDMATKALVFK